MTTSNSSRFKVQGSRFSRSHAPAWECIRNSLYRVNRGGSLFIVGMHTEWKMGRTRYKITKPNSPHFMTCTVLHWIPVFTRPETVTILLDSLRFLIQDGMKLYAYIILENHLHLIAQSTQLDKDIARFKSYTAKKLLHYLDKNKVKTILEQLTFYKKAHKTD